MVSCLKCLAIEVAKLSVFGWMSAAEKCCLHAGTHPCALLRFTATCRFPQLPFPALAPRAVWKSLRKGGVSPITPALLPCLAACNLSWLPQFIDLGSVALPNNERLAHEPWGGLLLNGNVSTPPYESKEGAQNGNVWKVKVNGVQGFYKGTATLQWLIKLSEVQMASIFKYANYRFTCFCVTLFS